MTTRARLQNANDSKSLWNYTLSPGFSRFDAHVLRLAIMRYGCGAWRQIQRHFPKKNCNQLNLQTQRLFGQQALAEFQKVHIDPNRIREINDEIEGFRKNSCLINTGNNVSAAERNRRRQEHIEKYGIPKELYQKIRIPVVLDPPEECKSLLDDIEKLREMYRCVYDIELRMRQLKANGGNNAENIKLNAQANATKANGTIKGTANEDGKSGESVSGGSASVNKNKNVKVLSENDKDGDIEMVVDNEEKVKECVDVDEDVALAMALSASMDAANIDTPIPAKTKKVKKKSTKKKSSKKKRKKMDDDDGDYSPGYAKKRVKRK